MEEIFAQGGLDKPYIIINSHFHWDHIWGNCAAKGFPIIAHKLCEELIDKHFDADFEENRQFARGNVIKQSPTLYFSSELYFAQDKIRLIHTPGHTIDSISVFDEEESILNIADNIGDAGCSLIPQLNCNEEIYRQSLLHYKSLNFEKCICSHNEIFGKDIIDKILAEF